MRNELVTITKALQHLGDYQASFEYNEESEGKWNNLQETMRELHLIETKLQKQKADSQKEERK